MDGRVHHQVLTSFVTRGHAPSVAMIAAALGLSRAAVEASLRRLHEGHGLVLHPDSLEVWIAHPFSASPTAVWVSSGSRGWWAPCLWCAAGIVALTAPTATIYACYAGQDEQVRLEVRDGAIVSNDELVHFAIPPRDAWSNVVHWCSTVLPFRNGDDVERWSEHHRLPRGEVVSWSKVLQLGKAWYGSHLDEDWRKWTVDEAQSIFEAAGLRSDFWQLPRSHRPF